MNSIQYQKIGLCIAGTKSRQGGFAPFMISGILAGNEDSNMDRVTLVVEKPVYVIKHTNEYILYLLIDRKVKPCDRDTLGVLSIALTIARDMQLANGKSPYALLKEVYDKFRNDYMESDGNECDRFINKDVNPADFVAIMEQYPLEKRSFDDYILMNPSGLSGKLRVPQEKMEDLFRDTQYQEFAQFKEIEVGVNCQSTPGLENIKIPRPIVYAIVMDDKRIRETMTRPDDFFDTASVLHNTSDIRYDNISFYLEDLLNSPEHQIQSGKSSVTLDMEGRCIRCKIHKEEIKYALEYRLEGGTEKGRTELGYLLLDKKVKLTMGGNIIEFPSSSPKKVSIPASWAHQRAGIQTEQRVTFEFRVTSTVDDENKHVMVTITIDTPKRDIYSGNSSGYQRRSFGLNVPATTQTYNGGRIEGDHEEDWAKLQSSNEQPSNKQPSNKTKKRWILYVVWCFIGMCIGAGIVGTVWWFTRKLSYDESLQIAKEKVRTVLFEKIISIDEADTLVTLRSLREAIEAKLRPQIEREVRNKIGEQKVAEAKAEKEAEEAEVEKKAAEAEAKKKAAAKEKQQAQNEILKLVNNGDYNKCMRSPYWEKLSTTEQNAVYYAIGIKGTDRERLHNRLQNYYKNDIFKEKYQTWQELEYVRSQIEKYQIYIEQKKK